MRLMSPMFSAFCLVAAVVSLSLIATAQTPQKKTTTAAAKAAPTAAGQKIFVDAKTRKIVQPTQSDIEALDRASKVKTNAKAAASVAPAESMTVISPYGVEGVLLNESTMSYAVASKGSDGKVSLGCVEGKDKAEVTVNDKEALDDK